MSQTDFDLDFHRAWGQPLFDAQLKAEPADFQVDEILDVTPGEVGEHWLLQLRNSGDNTAWVAGQLARLAGIPARDVGYCGLKDRHAVTSQWFSLYQPKGAEPDWSALESEQLQVLQCGRTERKLRRGQHSGNEFVIRLCHLRALTGDASEQLERRLDQIAQEGVPNYFGAQRFGRAVGNLARAQGMLVYGQRIRERQQRAMAQSAARAWLFNQVLAERIRRGDWRTTLPGDPESVATGPLWGRGRPLAQDETLALESGVLGPWGEWCAGLEHVGLKQERRPLVLRPQSWSWTRGQDSLELRFRLPPGTFATSVVRELVRVWEPERAAPG